MFDIYNNNPDVPRSWYIDFIDYVNYILVVEHAEPGRIETLFSLIDMEGVGIFDLPVRFALDAANSLDARFEGRLGRVAVVNNHWII